MKEQIKAPEKIQLSDEEIANLPDAQFKTLVIKMLTELVESVQKPDEKMKLMLRENLQETVLCGMDPAPTQKGQWKARPRTQDPRPRIGSPMGS